MNAFRSFPRSRGSRLGRCTTIRREVRCCSNQDHAIRTHNPGPEGIRGLRGPRPTPIGESRPQGSPHARDSHLSEQGRQSRGREAVGVHSPTLPEFRDATIHVAHGAMAERLIRFLAKLEATGPCRFPEAFTLNPAMRGGCPVRQIRLESSTWIPQPNKTTSARPSAVPMRANIG